MRHKTLLTKRVEFSASHRYWNAKWSEEKNVEVFGKCTSKYGHGHNYLLEVTVEGEVDQDTGMIINLYELQPMISDVVKNFDHKFLNEDTPFFTDKIPTTENIASVLWDLMGSKLNGIPRCSLYRIRLYETPDLFVEYGRIDG